MLSLINDDGSKEFLLIQLKILIERRKSNTSQDLLMVVIRSSFSCWRFSKSLFKEIKTIFHGSGMLELQDVVGYSVNLILSVLIHLKFGTSSKVNHHKYYPDQQ